jgi:hypothetical protein
VSFSFFSLFNFIAIFQVLYCAFLIFHNFQYFSLYFRSYSVCVLISMFFRFFPVFHVLQYEFLIFHVIQYFSPYSRYSVCFSFFMLFSVSRHTPGPTVRISHFPRFLVFFAIFQVKQCLCLFFHILKFSLHIPGPTVCISYSSRFSVFLAIF